ncbi:hypothetical protein BsWGS_05221 [Bradybaena similaris]
MNIYTLVLSNQRIASLVTLHSMCAILIVSVTVTVESSNIGVSAAGPLLPHDDKDVQKKLNCSSLEANKLNKTNCPNTNRSDDPNSNLSSWKQKMLENKDMLLRTLYVTLGITGIIVVYFVARTCWLRSRRTKSRKYRIIAQNGDQRDLEMEPLGDGNDDDEDYTVFELNGRKK